MIKKKKNKLSNEKPCLISPSSFIQEGDKIALAESTGLDQRQINNWFINQRKRHWKPCESMQFSMMDNLTGGGFHTDE